MGPFSAAFSTVALEEQPPLSSPSTPSLPLRHQPEVTDTLLLHPAPGRQGERGRQLPFYCVRAVQP